MTGITDLIRRMRELGAPIEAIEVAVAAIESIWNRDSERRRKNAARMRGKREEENVCAQSDQSASNVQHVCETENALSSSLSSREEKKERKKEIARQPRGTKISPDWKPDNRHFTEAQQLGFSEAEVTVMAEDMRLWAEANSNRQVARKADWNLTFLGWMRRCKKAPVNGKANGNHTQIGRKSNKDHPNWIRQDGPEWKAWTVFRKGIPFPPDADGGWIAPSRWPPNQLN